jgi:4-hydroxy-tetrahydrodipicolinate reductase
MVKAIVSGAAGRMGRRIVSAVCDSAGIEVGAGLEAPNHPALGKDVGLAAGVNHLGINIRQRLEDVLNQGDVLIEFTTPEASIAHLQIAAGAGKPMVIGTTGFSAEQLDIINQLAQKIPVVFSPNMSVGVNLAFGVLEIIARALGDDYDVEIVEAHHRKKVDAPSGTALKMAQVVAQALGRKLEEVGVYGRRGRIGERKPEEIGVHTIRGGDIVGTHTVLFAGIGESIEFTHRAHSRDTFAKGAVRAAKFVVDAPPGLHDMQAVLGL